ncbi:DUF3726 domain-containing protein [Planktotalea sp.]|uniref:DUF3726 domain-containing protein n=1 Tax=Planktotalea sp. TaxID=2029877 RepID=UPI0025F67426|nr:DUF3726 domain-containing protein [Planktotalea sp.]
MRSANEIAGMVLKAARGAGMPLGCAEELSRAAPNLAARDALAIVPKLLALDFAAPAYVENAISGGHPVHAIIAWRDFCASGLEVRLETAVPPDLLGAMQTATPQAGPFDIAPDIWDKLQSFAERTFVPETDASRLAGAGAGLTDND